MKKETDYSIIQERLRSVCAHIGCSEREFSRTIGKSGSYIANLKKDITTNVLLNIYITYPQINIMWIVTGEGEILHQNSNETIKSANEATLLTMFKDKDKACAQLQKEKDALIEQNHQLEKEVQSLKTALGIEEIPKSKVG